MTTASNAILSNSINSITGATGNIDIATTQTSGVLNIGTGSRTATGFIYIGSTGSTGPIRIETISTNNTYDNPAVSIATATGTRTIRIGNSATPITIGSYIVSGNTLNHRTATAALSIAGNQTDGILNIATGTRTGLGSIFIGTGASSTTAVNIHNGTGSTGSVNIANGVQSTTVNIQSGTGTGTVTIGNANNIVALNGQTNLSRPLGLGSTATLASQLGYRAGNLITTTSNFTATTANIPVDAKSFTFPVTPVSGVVLPAVWFVELRLLVNTISTTKVSLSNNTNTLSDERLSIVNNTSTNTSTILSTVIVEPSTNPTWYVVVESDIANTVFAQINVFVTRIG